MQEFYILLTSLRIRAVRKAAPTRKLIWHSKQGIIKKKGSKMAGGQRIDPYLNSRFRGEIDGIQQAGFMECTGLGSHVEVVEYREGGDNATVRKLPGRVSYPDITLKWGITDSSELYKWHLAVIQGQLERKDGSVVLLNAQGQEKLRWHFFNVWPSKWTGPTLNSKGSDVAIEELTLTCERQGQVT
jgi:phage tail-like protein